VIFKQLEVLSDEEVTRIIDAAFDILEKTGCRFESGWTRKQLNEKGCLLNDAKSVVRVPRKNMEKFLDEAARLDPAKSRAALHLPGAMRTTIIDPGENKPRPSILEDVKDVIKVSNALDCVEVVSAGVLPTDVPESAADTVNASLLMQYSAKPFAQQPYSRNSARAILSMAEVFYGDRENIRERGETGYLLATSGPLRYTRTSLELARMYATLGLPVVIGSRGRMGAEAPATVAGALVMLTAEFMAGLAYMMVVESPTRLAFSDGMRAVDASGRMRWNGPEQVARVLGSKKIAAKLGFPAAPFSAESDSPDFDFSSGWERSLTKVFDWSAGGDPFGPVGNMPHAFSIPQMLLDNEGMRMIRKLEDCATVDDEHLARDVIERVGVGGNFLAEKHTVDHMRDLWEPEIFIADPYDEWMKNGAKGVGEVAAAKALDMLKNEKLDLMIDEKKANEIQAIADTYVAKSSKA